jgi:group I intron endonuclease
MNDLKTILDTGIYTITSPSGHCYVGSTVDFKRRWCKHLCFLRKGTHHSLALQHAWNKYGEENIVFKKIFLCRRQDLLKWEQHFIDKLNPKYNTCLIAGNTLGVMHSEESKQKISLAKKGRKASEETRKRMSNSKKGRVMYSKKIKCVETGIVFNSISEAARQFVSGQKQVRSAVANIVQACKGKCDRRYGYHWRYVN